MKAILLDEAKKWLEENCENQYTRMAVFGIMQSMPTVDYQETPNEWVEALEAINNAAVAYMEGGPYENDLPGMEFAVEIDRLSRDFVRPPNKPLTLEQLREMDEVPIYVVTEKRGKGWCILSWHGVNKSFTFFSKTGTSEGMTAVPLSASTYGDRWLAYRRQPEGKED